MTNSGGRWTGPIIDAHHHVWDPAAHNYPWLSGDLLVPHRYGDYTPIKRRYLPPDYKRDIVDQNLMASIYCEAEWDPTDPIGETRYVSSLAAADGLPNAMVAQAWLDRDDADELLAQQASFPLVRSVRHKPGGPTSPADVGHGKKTLMSDEKWRRGYSLLQRHGLHFDLQVPWWNLPEAAILARDFPGIQLIVNHTGVPNDRSPETLSGWRRNMEMVAAQPNTAVKISGLCIPGRRWSTADSASVILDTIAMFGPNRVMFGSNFPVDGMFATFAQIFDTFREVTASFSDDNKRAMFCDTAVRLYRPLQGASLQPLPPSHR
jgi:predicted TIM-barrel fold metal-dependent hydrolase